jgi:hypothetical protein
MFNAKELALAALYMSCNLLTASKKPVNSITMAEALSLPDGTSFYMKFEIAEERLNGEGVPWGVQAEAGPAEAVCCHCT